MAQHAPTLTPIRRTAPRLLATLALTATVAACATPTSPADRTSPSGAATSTPQAPPAQGRGGSAEPLTLDNCGFAVTIDAVPERVLTIKSSPLELMLALGLGDRVAAAAWLDGPVPEEMAEAASAIDVISEQAPGPEAVLDLGPDMVFAGWESNFSVESAGERATLDNLGLITYVAPSACKGADYMPDPLTFEDVFADMREAGAIFGVPDAAATLVDEQRTALRALTPDDRGLTALWYSSGRDTPFVGAGIGAPAMIMEAVGLENIAGDVHDTWTSLSWEQVAAEDPDVLVLVDAAWNSFEQKVEFLEANPATAQLTAVREQRYLAVPFPATEAGVRNVEAVRSLLEQLDEIESR